MMIVLRSFKLLVALAVLMAAVFGVRIGTASRTAVVNLQFVHYLQAGLPEQDVFIEPYHARDDIPSSFIYPLEPHNPRDNIPAAFIQPRDILAPNVIRVAGQDALTSSNLSKMLFAADTLAPHDPYKLGPKPLGPFLKGDTLGFTLRQWLAAQGSGTYIVRGEEAELNLSFQHLVPDGRYALWCSRMSAPPHYMEVEKACGAADGSQNIFRADSQGNAILHLKLSALPESTHEVMTVLTVTYEREVETWDGQWGGYGLSSHVQLFYTFPAPLASTLVCRGQHAC